MKKYSVLLVDDHPIVLEGTKNLINTSALFEVTSATNRPEEAVSLLKDKDYDVLITDYEMSGLTGQELVRIAKVAQPDIKTIVLSMHDDATVIKELLRLGVNGYVLKSDAPESIKAALDKVTSGKRYLSDEITDILVERMDDTENTVLTPREEEIVRLIAKEYSTKQIAEILFISDRTVETHRKNIIKKTGCTNLVALIKYAYSNNLVSD